MYICGVKCLLLLHAEIAAPILMEWYPGLTQRLFFISEYQRQVLLVDLIEDFSNLAMWSLEPRFKFFAIMIKYSERCRMPKKYFFDFGIKLKKYLRKVTHIPLSQPDIHLTVNTISSSFNQMACCIASPTSISIQ